MARDYFDNWLVWVITRTHFCILYKAPAQEGSFVVDNLEVHRELPEGPLRAEGDLPHCI